MLPVIYLPNQNLPSTPAFDTLHLMSTVEKVVEKVRQMDDEHARQLLVWLETQEHLEFKQPAPLGAMAMLGFASRLHDKPRTTEEWMAELRAGERD